MGLRKRFLIAGAAAAAACLLAGVIGCTQAEEPTPDPEEVTQYAPEVRRMANGKLVQLTPVDSRSDAYYFQQRDFVPYNTYWIDADNRGCKSCHDDLKAVLDESPYQHAGIGTGVDTEWTIDTCLGCHNGLPEGYFTEEGTFPTVMHAIHQDKAECFQCHDISEDWYTGEDGMAMWDSVKHAKMRGIVWLTEEYLPEEFTYTQEYVTDAETLFDLGAQSTYLDFMRTDNEAEDAPLDQAMFDEWVISVDGDAVTTPKSWTLAELKEVAPMVTQLVTFNCTIGPANSGAIGQLEVTGVPVSWIFDQAGATEEAVWCQGMAGDYYGAYYTNDYQWAYQYGILALEFNGEPISWANGYPCVYVLPGFTSGYFVKEVSSFTVGTYETMPPAYVSDDLDERTASLYEMLYEPDFGYFDLEEGQIIRTGEPFTITGYSDYNGPYGGGAITSVSFSMDYGYTWKTFEIADADPNQWLVWSYTFTPPMDGAYCLLVKCACDDGFESWSYADKMVVARSDVDELEAMIP